MKKHSPKELKAAIEQKENQLKKLISHVDKSSVCSDLYNKVVLEKAILNKELQDIKNNCVISKIKKVIPRKKTLICDYFKN